MFSRINKIKYFYKKNLLFLFLIFVLKINFLAASEWEQKKNKSGIEIYLREIEGSEYKELKAIMKLKTTLVSLVSLLDDTASYPLWIYQCTKASLLEKTEMENSEIRYTYTELDFSMITSKRDLITQSTLTQDSNSKTIFILLKGFPEYITKKENIVRVAKLNGFWKLEPVNNGEILITYQLHMNPGGNLLSWIVNSTLIDIGFETLHKMKKMVLLPKYKNAKIIKIKEP
ncbi:MAG: START domain-containing protein [Spirochaetia bacterium]|nr:START domain-containing protein [Spirochaetia bacterium]